MYTYLYLHMRLHGMIPRQLLIMIDSPELIPVSGTKESQEPKEATAESFTCKKFPNSFIAQALCLVLVLWRLTYHQMGCRNCLDDGERGTFVWTASGASQR